ncbi:ABC transporter substrate-binding protein [Acinetobacter ursingii]|uniref:ABC transporter substrate-binding protein n=1 Tax=Acinetobacter ursingii TaxID=108980 RepID=UPI0021CDD42A|nr:ABC transporter substrate-binding protein [Acinetobacter ursingii]MCU4482702.1 ABC transporter substrate-binding protein [Acinetobacter ursingii]MCU4507024.1 ABC transporter substrate-binding protein [Acinetobacter ursingii]
MRHSRYNGHSDLILSHFSFPKVVMFSICVLLGITLTACQPRNITEQKPQLETQSVQTTPSHSRLSVVDSSGYRVTLEHPAQRVVCLFESSCDGLYMLNQGNKIVGIPAEIYQQPMLYHAYSVLDRRIQAKQIQSPSQGNNATNIESLLMLQPDLVIMGGGEKQTIALLRKLGIAVYIMESSTYAQVKEELSNIAILTDATVRAKTILQYSDQKITEIQRNTAKQPHQQTIYYAWSGGRIFSTSGTQSITNDFIELAGAKNIVSTKTNQPNVNPETLIEWNPDNIVLWNTDPQLIYQRPELQTLKSVQQRRVFNLSPAFIYNPHTIKIVLTALYLHHHIYTDVQSSDNMKETQYQVLSMLYGSKAAQALNAP